MTTTTPGRRTRRADAPVGAAPAAPASPELGDDDEDRGFSPAWFHPLIAGVWLLVLAMVPTWSGVSPWLWAPVGLACTLVARVAVKQWVTAIEHGQLTFDHARNFALLAGVSATGWLVYAGFELPVRAGRALGTLALWLVTMGTMYAVLRHKAPIRAQEIREVNEEKAQARHEERLRTEIADQWESWFVQAGLVGVQVDQVCSTLAGYTLTLGVYPTVKEDGTTAALTRYSGLTGAIEVLASLASRHYAREGKVIALDQLRPETTEAAHEWLLHVDTEQPLKQTMPHPGDRGAGTITRPIRMGIYQDGSPLDLDLYGSHVAMVATTGGGKSVVLNNVIDGITRCGDQHLWIGTTSKLMPVVWPWLKPWLDGTTTRPVIERVAGESLDEVLLMLCDAYRWGMEHNGRLGPDGPKHIPTPQNPGLTIILDEATHVASNKTAKVTTHDGREWTASALFNALCAMLRSAGGGMFFVTQYGLISALGDYGTDTMRNVTVRIAGKTMKAFDGTATLSGMKVDTTTLRDNKILVQPNNEVPRIIPAKTYLLESEQEIRALAIAHTRYRPAEFPTWLVDAMGGSYTERWLPERQDTLVKACQYANLPYPIGADGEPVAGRTVAAGFTPDPTRPTPAPHAAAPRVDTGNPEHTQPTSTSTDPGVSDTSPAPNTPGPLRPHPTPGSMEPMTTTPRPNYSSRVSTQPTIGDLAEAADNFKTALAEMEEYGPLGKHMTMTYWAFTDENAPAQATLRQVAFASHIVTPDAPEEVIRNAMSRILKALVHLGAVPAVPEQRTGSDDPHNPVIEQSAVIEAWNRARAEIEAFQAGKRAEQSSGDPVVAAVAGRNREDWITVGELGRLAGQIPSDTNEDSDEYRQAARRFSELLRTRYQLGDEAFKRTARGTAVQVGVLRAAAGSNAA